MPICRVCLQTSLEYIDLGTPFDTEETQDSVEEATTMENSGNTAFTYLDCFRKCTQLDVNCGFDMSQSLCSSCGIELKITYGFLQRAKKAEKLLQTAAKEIKLKIDINTEHQEIEIEPVYEEVLGEIVADEASAKVVSKETLYKCDFCKETFFSPFVLNLHTARMHTEIITEVTVIEEVENGELLKDEMIDTEQLSEVVVTTTVEETSGECIYHSETEYLDSEFDVIEDEVEVVEEIETSTVDVDEDSQNFVCSSCSSTFPSRGLLMQHRWEKHVIKPARYCKICNADISDYESRRDHNIEAHGDMRKCTDCDYADEEYLVFEHEQQVHGKRTQLKCHLCPKTFQSKCVLNAHLRYHQRKIDNIKSDACTVCGKKFSTRHYLLKHMATIHKERALHQCEDCNKLYITKGALDIHMRIHRGNVKECNVCGKEFLRNHDLKIHMRFHNRDYRFQCEICSKKFAIKGHLRTHMWTHQGLKLQCEQCGKLFTSSKSLNEHSFVHTQMPFPCSYCQKAYPSRQKYKMHLNSVHRIDISTEELKKIPSIDGPIPYQRRKLTLVQVDTVMKEVEIESKESDNDDVEAVKITLL